MERGISYYCVLQVQTKQGEEARSSQLEQLLVIEFAEYWDNNRIGTRYVNNARIARSAEGEVSGISDFNRAIRVSNKHSAHRYHSIVRLVNRAQLR